MVERHQRVFKRLHNDLFEDSSYDADFYNTTSDSWDPDADDMNTTRDSSPFATIEVEYIPPTMDSTIDIDGSSFSWDTSIRFPSGDINQGNLNPAGEDAEKVTEVEIDDPVEGDTVVYELHSYTVETGSNMTMCRLVEQ